MGKISLRNLLSVSQKRFFRSKVKPPPLDSALLACKTLQISQDNSPNFVSVFNCFKSHGFDDGQIIKIVEKYPHTIRCNVNKTLNPKFEYLGRKGFKGQLLPRLISCNPNILFRSLDNQIKPFFEFMQSYLNDEELLIALKRSSSRLLNQRLNEVLQPNIDILIGEGVPVSMISKLLIRQPRVILLRPDIFSYKVKTVKETGLEPNRSSFVEALRVVCSLSEVNWKKKVELFMSLGWSEEDILATLKKYPLCFCTSEKKVRYLMDFYVNTMKMDAKIIIAYTQLLRYSIDKRVVRRYNVVKVLASKNLMKDGWTGIWLMKLPEKKFLKEYVTKFKDEIPDLLDIYQPAVKKTNQPDTR